MDDLIRNALKWFAANWDTAICGSTDAARFLSIKSNTLKTRINREQALAMRIPGDIRGTVAFTGRMLVYNLLQDVFIRHGIPAEDLQSGDCRQIHKWCEIVEKEVVSPPYNGDVVFRAVVRNEDRAVFHEFPDDNFTEMTGEPAVMIPIGTMVIRIALDLYMKMRAAA